MLEALLVTLREGIEAALAVGIIVAFLRRGGYDRHLSAVWSGLGTAVVASLVAAWGLYRWAVNEEVFEGVLYLTSAVLVGSMVFWMWRHARSLAGDLRTSLGRIVSKGDTTVKISLFAFTFFVVFREGMETVFFLSALSLSSGSLLTLLGVLVGLVLAVAFGVLFTRGSLRIDLGRFFKVTGIALLIFVVQLLLNGYHELAEAGWVPANERSMATLGPLVKDEFFFVAAVLILPLLMLLIPGKSTTAEASGNAAQDRLERARALRLSRARAFAGVAGVVILAALSLGFIYTRPPSELSPAETLVPGADGSVHLPVASLDDAKLHRYLVTTAGATVRFIALAIEPRKGPYVVAFDACEICGAKGYVQDSGAIACLHCGSTIYPPSIGQEGGCNPIPLPSHVDNGLLVVAAHDLSRGAATFAPAATHHHQAMH
jgi:high-affinity iron transporter